MRVIEYWQVVRRQWRVVVGCALLGILAATVFAMTESPRYSASSKVFVSTTYATNLTDIQQGAIFAQSIVASYADAATSPLTLDPVIQELDLQQSAAALQQDVTATATADTSIIDITVLSNSPINAAHISNAIASQMQETVDSLTPASSGNEAGVKASVLEQALPTKTPVSPRPLEYVLIGLFVGTSIGFMASLAIAITRARPYTADDLNRVTSRPLIGLIPKTTLLDSTKLPAISHQFSPFAESIRALRASLRFLRHDTSRCYLFTSSISSEGKSTLVANLAVSLSQTGATVALVDCDLRRPMLADLFGVDASLGLTNILIGEQHLDDMLVVVTGENSGLSLLPAGNTAPNPAELLQSSALLQLFTELRSRFDYVLVDSAPILPVADSIELTSVVDGVIVVAALGRVKDSQVRATLDRLQTVNIIPEGIVGTFASVPEKQQYAYYRGTQEAR